MQEIITIGNDVFTVDVNVSIRNYLHIIIVSLSVLGVTKSSTILKI